MALSNLRKVTLTYPFPAGYSINRDALVFPYVDFSLADATEVVGANFCITMRKTGLNQQATAFWGNMRALNGQFLSLSHAEQVNYAFVPNDYIFNFRLPSGSKVELYILELDTSVGEL